MRPHLAAVLAFAGLATAASSAEQRAPTPASCIPAYTPGVDAHGRPVAPADATPPVTVEVGPNVVAEVRTRNPVVKEALVGVRVNGLTEVMNLPPCPPALRQTLPR
jgi:hypothetical protein